MATKKKTEYITLRFAAGGNTYQARAVPIMEHINICGVNGFALHHFYPHWTGDPDYGQYAVSHIDSGMRIGYGPTDEAAIAHARESAEKNGGNLGLRLRVENSMARLREMTAA